MLTTITDNAESQDLKTRFKACKMECAKFVFDIKRVNVARSLIFAPSFKKVKKPSGIKYSSNSSLRCSR